jgi:hypothetical protein
VHPEADLPQVVGTLDPRGGLPDLLDGGEEQPDEDGDDADDDEEFDEGEG